MVAAPGTLNRLDAGETIELTVAFGATNEEVASSVGTLSLGDFIVPVSISRPSKIVLSMSP